LKLGLDPRAFRGRRPPPRLPNPNLGSFLAAGAGGGPDAIKQITRGKGPSS
jgi:hypothetical protein